MARETGPLVVCVINLKGGVGKSTITALLAEYAFNTLRKDVLAIDLDPQANLSQGLLHQNYENFIRRKRPSIVELFNGYLPPNSTSSSPTPLTSSGITETVFESGDRKLELIASRFDFSDHLLDAIRPDPKVLAKFLSRSFKAKDLILIDCSPTESVFTTAAYYASRLVLIPVKPEYFATIGFPLLAESIDRFKKRNRAHEIDVAGVVINNPFYHGGNDGGPEKAEALTQIRADAKKNNWHIFSRQLPHSRGFPKMMRGNYTHLGNAYQFRYFAKEFFDRIAL